VTKGLGSGLANCLDLTILVIAHLHDARSLGEGGGQPLAVVGGDHVLEGVREDQMQHRVGLQRACRAAYATDEFAEVPRRRQAPLDLLRVERLPLDHELHEEAHVRVAPALAGPVRRNATGMEGFL